MVIEKLKWSLAEYFLPLLVGFVIRIELSCHCGKTVGCCEVLEQLGK